MSFRFFDVLKMFLLWISQQTVEIQDSESLTTWSTNFLKRTSHQCSACQLTFSKPTNEPEALKRCSSWGSWWGRQRVPLNLNAKNGAPSCRQCSRSGRSWTSRRGSSSTRRPRGLAEVRARQKRNPSRLSLSWNSTMPSHLFRWENSNKNTL